MRRALREYVEVVCPTTSRVELSKVTASFDTKCPHNLIPEIAHACRMQIQLPDVIHDAEYIDDRLSQNSRNSGATNMVQNNPHVTYGAANSFCLSLKGNFPIGIVRDNDNAHANSMTAQRKDGNVSYWPKADVLWLPAHVLRLGQS